jgi:hypothetical protein
MAQNVCISPSITPSESVSSAGTLARSTKTPSILLPPPARDPHVICIKNKTYRRNFLVRNKRPRTGWYWKEGTEWDEEIGEEVYQCWVCRHCVSFRPIRATRANHIKSHLKKEHQIKEGDDNVPAFGIRESFILTPEAESSTSILFNYSISDKTKLRRRHCRKTLFN